jgi:ethanolamine ammonia-lyase large subunit
MLNYQTTSFHDALYARRVLGLRPAPEFEIWLEEIGIMAADRRVILAAVSLKRFSRALSLLDRR